MDVGTLLCLFILLIGLTITVEMSWWWWLAAFLIGWAVNLSMRYGAKWYVKRRKSEPQTLSNK